MSQYPKEYEKTITLRDGTKVLIRPELSTDAQMLWEMVSTLSSESKRFLGGGITRKKVQAWTSKINYDRVLPLVAVVEEKGKTRIVASVSLRFFTEFPAFQHRAEFGITVKSQTISLPFKGSPIPASIIMASMALHATMLLTTLSLPISHCLEEAATIACPKAMPPSPGGT